MANEIPKDDTELPGGSTRLFQINEDDLAELERLVPILYDRAAEKMDDNKSRVMVRRVKDIISNVRWNYAPWSNIETLPAGDGND